MARGKYLSLEEADDFEQWCDAVKERKAESSLTLNEYAKTKEGTNAQKVAQFEGEMRSQIQHGRLSLQNVSINGNVAGGERFRLDLSYQSPDLQIHKDSELHVLGIYTQEIKACELSSVIIGRLAIGAKTTLLSLDHCRVESLLINKGQKTVNVRITDSWIGHLEVKSGAVHDLLIGGGTIRSVRCPAPDEDNPINGHVRFWDVDFPTDLKPGFREGAQPYTNLRAHLEELQNAPMAGLMRARELETERRLEGLTLNNLWSYFWGWSANFGYSPGRALRRAGYLILIMAAVIWLGDGGAPGLPDERYRPGTWRADFLNPGYSKMQAPRDRFEAIWTVGISLARRDPLPAADLEIVLNPAAMWRSAFLPFQAAANPLGIFGSRSLVIASTHWGNLFLTLFGLVTDLLIVMAILGIRKRFKLH